MANPRMLKDTVTLYNYVGEVNDEAYYQDTILTNCYCPLNEGADLNLQGKKANDSARLYIFDANTIASGADGEERTFLPYETWKALTASEKSSYWTLSDKGTDYFRKSGSNIRLRIIGFCHKKAGRKRMWHYEVDGR